MRKLSIYFFILSLLICSLVRAQEIQNLVVNPSFEELHDCPPANLLTAIHYAKGWFSWFGDRYPGTRTPFAICVFSPCGDHLGSAYWKNSAGFMWNALGYQKPQHGLNYASFIGNWYEKTPATPAISGTLLKPLVMNKTYNIKFYVSLSDYTFKTYIKNLTLITHVDSNLYNWDLYNHHNSFMPKYRTFVDSIILSFEHPVHPIPTDWLNDTLNWIEVKGKFTARGGERYFTIGKIQHSSEMAEDVIVDTNPWYTNSYYFIDNVQIWAEPEEPKLPIQIPNVITPNQDGYNDTWQIQNLAEGTQVSIYNRWGSRVYQSNNYQNNWPQPNNAPASGTYFYIVRTQDGQELKGSLIVNY